MKRNRSMRFSEKELWLLSRIIDSFTEYMIKDDRPDHGLARLKHYRDRADEETKKTLLTLSGRLTYNYRHPRKKE